MMAHSSKGTLESLEGRPSRVVIENVAPQVDDGRFLVKRTVGETVEVTADIHADGHDELGAVLRYRRETDREWTEVRMTPLSNDRWGASFQVSELTNYEYELEAWVDPFLSWRRDLASRVDAGEDISVELLVGAGLIEEAASRAMSADAAALVDWAAELRAESRKGAKADGAAALDTARGQVMHRHAERRGKAVSRRPLRVSVERDRARFSAWYEMFPRSCASAGGKHATLRDCEGRLAYVAKMGFDVLYLPPIHPIGTSYRKGRNNSEVCSPSNVGSPWAIGAAEGGHKAVHPQLGTLDDFRRFVETAGKYGIEIALDIAFQCSFDHPWLKEHPGWFRHRPDGSIRYAENPPKKYQDIYPLDFDCDDWKELWGELLSVVTFWIEQGVRIFRVDNPHTKPYMFWEWMIAEIRREHPDVIFLSEAFTRPKVMYRLAKLGFTQSYTYFAWRNTSWEIRDYFTELTQTGVREFFRPNLWPNTPDILTEYLQAGGRAAFQSRFILAATLGANYGIYGPAFELCENRPLVPGKEEYLDSEKYQIRKWDLDRADSLKDLIARVNRIRRENPALQSDRGLRFHTVDNDQMIAYSKSTDDLSNIILTVVNLDPNHTHSGFVELPLRTMEIDEAQPFQVHDLLTGARYIWNGPRNYVELNPAVMPSHILKLRRRLRTERDFDYYL